MYVNTSKAFVESYGIDIEDYIPDVIKSCNDNITLKD